MREEAKQETGVTKREKSPIMAGKFGLELTSIDDMGRFADCVVQSGLAPKGVDTIQKVVIAVQAGAEIGLKPMQSLQSIAVINGRPAVWGDAVLGLCMGSGQMERYKTEEIGEKGKDSWGHRVTVKRKGYEAIVSEFTVGDAKQAALWGKTGPWAQYPGRMLLNRARAFALRDTFADVLKGCPIAEEVQDTPVKDVPITITEPDGKQTHTKAKGMKAVKEALQTKPEPEPTAPSTPTLTPEQIADIEDREAKEAGGELFNK